MSRRELKSLGAIEIPDPAPAEPEPGFEDGGSLEAPAAGTGVLAVISAIVLWQVYTGMDFRVTSG